MVNTLSGSVSAYRKEIVKPRFIRIDEVMALLDVTQDEAMDIALAAGARYQLAKIILVHKERLMKFMKHLLFLAFFQVLLLFQIFGAIKANILNMNG